MPPKNQEKRLPQRCKVAGNVTDCGWAAIEAEGSVEGVRITEIQGMCNDSATMEAANCGATEMSRSACWHISRNSVTFAGKAGRMSCFTKRFNEVSGLSLLK